jgi:hypothetical protein
LTFSFLKRFRTQCRSLGPPEQGGILRALMDLETALANPQEHRGLGLRKLHPTGIWEIRVGLSLRALFRVSEGEAVFVFLGTHDEVRRFLRDLG